MKTIIRLKLNENYCRWIQCFGVSMAWLALFSYLMVTAADGLHEGFGIPMDLLGITVCAVGTSFPNFWASILMAKQGRASMAVANARCAIGAKLHLQQQREKEYNEHDERLE